MAAVGQSYRFGGFTLNVPERRLTSDGQVVYLPPKTFETLKFLVEHPDRLVSKSDLLEAVWPGVSVTENVLTRCIKEVRQALRDDAHEPTFIETVPRVGYGFMAPVEAVVPADPPAGRRRRWPVVAAAVLFLLVPAGSYLASRLEALSLYSDGVDLWSRGQPAAAVQRYEAAIRKDPGFAMAHAALGLAYSSHIYSNAVKGRRHYERALELAGRTTDRERLSIRASYEADLGHEQEATRLFEAYLQSYPNDIPMRGNFARMLMLRDHCRDAIGQFQELTRLVPRRASAWVNLATCFGHLGQYRQALGSYAKAFEIEPTWIASDNLNHEYGFLMARSGDIGGARAVMGRALATGTRASALRSLALLDMYEGRYASAKDRLGQALADNERRSAFTLEGLARAHRMAGNAADALRFYELLVALKDRAVGFEPQPGWFAAHVALARLYLDRGDREKASAVLGVFLGLWKHADADLPLLREAQRLVAALGATRGRPPS